MANEEPIIGEVVDELPPDGREYNYEGKYGLVRKLADENPGKWVRVKLPSRADAQLAAVSMRHERFLIRLRYENVYIMRKPNENKNGTA